MRRGRRNDFIAIVVKPLRGQGTDSDVDRIAHTFRVVVGTDALLDLTDGVGLESHATAPLLPGRTERRHGGQPICSVAPCGRSDP